MTGFVLKPYRIKVFGHGEYIYFARSRGRATAKAFSDFADIYSCTFKDFLKRSTVSAAEMRLDPRLGEPLTVCGAPGFYVSHDSQYIHFVRPGSDVVLHAHPLDVEPPEARRGTPYFTAKAA